MNSLLVFDAVHSVHLSSLMQQSNIDLTKPLKMALRLPDCIFIDRQLVCAYT